MDTVDQTGQRTGVITRVARQLGIGTESLRSWVRQDTASSDADDHEPGRI